MGLERTVYMEPVKGFGKIPHCIYDMQLEKKKDAIVVFCFLHRRLNNKTGQCNPSLKDIARHVGMSERQVTRVLHILEKKGVIRISRRRGYGNHYELPPPREWDWIQVKRQKETKLLTSGQRSIGPWAPP